MASILKVDEMQGVTSAGDITITSEGGSATQSLQQGLAKHWINLDSDAGTPAALDSLNTASVSDNGTGIPENFNIEENSTLGFKIINTLVKQLQGSLSITNDNGTVVKISF